MKSVKMWAVIDPDGEIVEGSVRESRIGSINHAWQPRWTPKSMTNPEFGYSVRRVTVTVESEGE